MALSDKDSLKDAIKKRASLEKGMPDIEVVSAHEIYLLDPETGDRVNKICGVQRPNMPKGFVCTQPAGKGTNHPGYAQCNIHDRYIPNSNNTRLWHRLNQSAGLPSTLGEYLDNASEIEEIHLTTVDDDIKALYGLLSYQLSKRRSEAKELKGGQVADDWVLSNDDIDLALKIQDKILKAKEVKIKLSKELILDTSTIKQFVHQMMNVAKDKLPDHQAKMLLKAFLDEVIIPFQTQGRVVGGKFDYQPQSGNIIGDISHE